MSPLSKSDIEVILTEKLGSQHYEFISCEDRSIDDISTGYLSTSAKVTIVYRVRGVVEKLHLFVKTLPEVESRREHLLSMGGFDKEVMVYNKILCRINVSQDNHPYFPKCYLAKSNDVIVLDDLSLKGYKNLDLREDFDLEHCKKTLECIAKLHASSFVFEKRRNSKLNEYIPYIEKEIVFSQEDGHVGRKRYFVGITALEALGKKYLTRFSKETVKKAIDFMEILPEKLDPSTVYPNVLTHGDLWCNNIMYDYDKEGNVKSACLIDFQCATYRPPSFDIQVFIHCCTDKKFRKDNYTYLLRFYFEELAKNVMEEGINIEDILSWNTFEEMCRHTLPLALVLAPQFMHFVGIPEEVIGPIMQNEEEWKKFYEVDREDIVLQAASQSLTYKKKLLEGLEDLFDYFESV